jgi:hypothetical protein
MRDIKIYLHTNTTRLQSLVHVLAATCLLLKAFRLQLNTPFYVFWFYFYICFGVLLGVAVLFQAVNKFGYRYLAVTFNILAGMAIIVERLVKLTVAENMVKFTAGTIGFYLLNFALGLFFVLMGVYEDRMRKMPYMAFNKNQVYGRQSWFSTFAYTWQDIADVNFRRNRVKVTTHKGEVYRYRVAKQSTGGIMYKSADYFCRQVIQAQGLERGASATG